MRKIGMWVAIAGLIGGGVALIARPAAASNTTYIFGTAVTVGANGTDGDGTCTGSSHTHPMVVAGSQVWMAYDADDGSGNHVIDVVQSTDGGVTFGTPVTLMTGSALAQCDPTMVRSGTTTYVAWSVNGGTSNGIAVASKDDSAGTWTSGYATNDGSLLVIPPSMAVGSSGVPLIAYATYDSGTSTYETNITQPTVNAGGTNLGAGSNPSVVATSTAWVVATNTGTTYTSPPGSGTWTTHAGAFGGSLDTSMAVDAGDNVWLGYDQFNNNCSCRVLHLAKSTDGGATFPDVDYSGGSGTNDIVTQGYNVAAAASGRAYLTAFDGNGRFGYTDDGGTTWSYFGATTIGTGNSCQYWPSAAAGTGTQAYVSYVSTAYCTSSNHTDVKVTCGDVGTTCSTGGGGTTTTTTTTTTLPSTTTTTIPRTTTTTTTTVPSSSGTGSPGPSLVGRLTGGIVVGMASTWDGKGYWVAGSDGNVYPFGDATPYGSLVSAHVSSPVAGIVATPGGHGYWLFTRDGRVFPFGSARALGSMAGTRLNAPIVAMAATSTGNGYWLVGADGGVFTFGSANFFGSAARMTLNGPITAFAPTVLDNGYWLVGTDGGVFTFGAARFLGSTGGTRLNAPITAFAATALSNGYWLVGKDGGVFTFGAASFRGSMAGHRLNAPISGFAVLPTDDGYWLAGEDGGIFALPQAPYLG